MMGALCCLTPIGSVLQLMIPVSAPAANPESEALQKMVWTSAIINIVVYGIFIAVLLSIAYASIFLRRWSRPLNLIVSWLLLYFGIIAMISISLMRPLIEEAMRVETPRSSTSSVMIASSPPLPTPPAPPTATAPSGTQTTTGPPSPSSAPVSPTTPPASSSLPTPTSPTVTPPPAMPSGMDNFFNIFMAVMFTMTFVFGVLLPILLVWLNWSEDVKVTLEFCDPKERWTDRCPIPVLGISFVAGIGAMTSLVSFLIPWAPFFGQILTGSAARLFFAVVILLLIFIAITSYRQKLVGWIAAAVLVVGSTVSGWLTFPHLNMTDLYAQMGMPQNFTEEVGVGGAYDAFFAPDSPLRYGMLFSFLPFAIYLGWVLRFFLPPKPGSPAEADSTPPAATG